MDLAIPAAKIAQLSSVEFVGLVADIPEAKINLKMFHSQIQNDHGAIAAEERQYQEIPIVSIVSGQDIQENYDLIKSEVRHIGCTELNAIKAGLEAVEAQNEVQHSNPAPNSL